MRPAGIPSNYVQIEPNNWVHPSRLVGGFSAPKPKQDPLPALDNSKKTRTGGKGSMAVRVSIIRVGKHLLDDDNLASSGKAIRDAVSKSLAIDDADPRISFEYDQIETKGRCGCIVKIERL